MNGSLSLEPHAQSVALAFLKSALSIQDTLHTEAEVLQWINQKKQATTVRIDQIEFSQMTDWLFDPESTDLVHVSRKFFSIVGINVKTNWGRVPEWEQLPKKSTAFCIF